MVPFLGMPVIVLGIYSNGTNEAPAVVTRVWNNADLDLAVPNQLVNLQVFPDYAPPLLQGSVAIFKDRASAAASMATQACYPNPALV